MNIGEHLRRLRTARNLSQGDLAEQLEVSRQSVSKWETDAAVPDLDNLMKLCQVFEVTLDELIGKASDADEERASESIDDIPAACEETPGEQPVFPAPAHATKSVTASHPKLRHPVWWLLGLPALVAAVLICVVPYFQMLFYSFTTYNVITLPEFVGFSNYATMAGDELVGLVTTNTVMLLVVAGGMSLLLGWVFGTSAARLPLPIGVIIGAVLGIGTLCALCNGGWGMLFSGDSYGLLNSWLMQGGAEEPTQWASVYPNLLQTIRQIALGIAPVYAIFYLGGRTGRTRQAWHIAVTAVPLLLVTNWQRALSSIGYPTVDYQGDWLPSLIYDYGATRYEIGYACALLTLLFVLMAGVIALGNVLVWALSHIRLAQSADRRPRPIHWVGGSFAIVAALHAVVFFELIFNMAVRPLPEFFEFPISFFTQQPTLENFAVFDNLWSAAPPLHHLPVYLLVSWVLFLLLILPTAVLFAFKRGKGLHVAAWCWLGVMGFTPFAMLSQVWWQPGAGASLLQAVVLSLTATPALPLCVLLTALVLRRSTAGCEGFREFFGCSRRWLTGILSLLPVWLLYSLSALFSIMPSVYDERYKFPLQWLSQLAGAGIAQVGALCAGELQLVLVGALFLVLLAAAMSLLLLRRKE